MTDSAQLLSFEQIMEIASRLLPIKYAHQEKYLEYRNEQVYCKTANRITLGYTRIQSKDNPKQFQLVPVLLTETAAAAYLAPLCLCYAMTMIGTRFFPQISMLNPANWLIGDVWLLLMLLALLVVAVLFTLRREVLRHA